MMKKFIKRIAAATLAIAIAANLSGVTTLAAESMENGNYTGTIHFCKEGSSTDYSMCDPIFCHTADIELTDDNAILTAYVAYPVPAFSSQGTDGTVKNVVITYDGTEYAFESDITSKPSKVFDTTGALFGITAGESYETQVLTATLPREAVNSFATGLDTAAYVNVVMNTDVNFVIVVTDLVSAGSSEDDTTATETNTQSVEVTANVAAPAATYEVTIPESIAFGTLSAEEDTVVDYTVSVEAENLGDGYVEIVTEANGELTSDDNKLAFTNSFGTQSTQETADLTGTLKVAATDVASANAGNYTGTANFVINYYAAN